MNVTPASIKAAAAFPMPSTGVEGNNGIRISGAIDKPRRANTPLPY